MLGNGSTSAVPPAASAGNTLGRKVITVGLPPPSTDANALPEYTGRVAVRTPPSDTSFVTSDRQPQPRRAATRPERSRPSMVAAMKTATGAHFSAAARTTAAHPSDE